MEMAFTMKEDYEIKFWKDWLGCDYLERLKLVKNLSIVREVSKLSKIPKKYSEEFFATYLNSFFEDLESAVYTKVRLENKKKKTKN